MRLFGEKKMTAIEWRNKGIDFAIRKKHRGAIESFNKGIDLNPNDEKLLTLIWLSRGGSHFALREFGEAIRCYDKAIELDSIYSDVGWELKGHVYYYWDRQKYYEDAKACLIKAAQMKERGYAIVRDKGYVHGTPRFKKSALTPEADLRFSYAAEIELALRRFQDIPEIKLIDDHLHECPLWK